ncbi:hypothetical protein FRC11_007497 [Ceratobasidium sp. 423]|nr:hypothetical protein FRC11_007497 [Ceratobasidium sp. 423]
MIYLIQRRRGTFQEHRLYARFSPEFLEYKAYSRVLMTIWNMLWLNSGSWATFIYDILSTSLPDRRVLIELTDEPYSPTNSTQLYKLNPDCDKLESNLANEFFNPTNFAPQRPNSDDFRNLGKLFVLSLLIALAG